jgi:hypothetical protein
MRTRESPDLANFDHGDNVGLGGRVFKAQWWMVWRWLAWLFYRWTDRARWVTFTTGERMRMVTDGNGITNGDER